MRHEQRTDGIRIALRRLRISAHGEVGASTEDRKGSRAARNEGVYAGVPSAERPVSQEDEASL